MKLKNTLVPVLVFAIFLLSSLSVFGQQQNALDIALRYLEQNQSTLKLTENDITNFHLSDLYASKHNGLTHVYLIQHHQEIEVYNGITSVNVRPDGQVLNVNNGFVHNLAQKVNTTTPSISPEQAIKTVISQLMKFGNPDIYLQERKGDHEFVFNVDGLAKGDVPVKLVYEVLKDKSVRLAWNLELQTMDEQNWWNARVDATNGTLLNYHNQVIHCIFDNTGNTCIDETHVHQSSNTVKRKTATARNTNANEALMANTYRVYPLTIESPNHGDRELVTSPADPVASPFGWHDTDGMAGPEYTITRGNNAHAYHDIFNLNQSAGDEPDGGPSLDFDFDLDLSTNLPYTQMEPVVVNLFYWMNLMHDLWYQYGFDEPAGNFQENNYGNGGLEGDYMRAEAMDGSGTNNANFSAGGTDGNRGRIQMYVWTDDQLPDIETPEDSLVVNLPDSLAGKYLMVAGGFGAPLPETPIVSEVVLVDDGVANPSNTDLCEDIINGAEVSGKIAMIDRGDCEFGIKCLRAENAGAIAVIVCNQLDTDPFAMGPGDDGGEVTIPAVMMSLADCNTIKMGLPGLTVELGSVDVDLEIPLPGPVGVTGDFDNNIIAHEYTHGISIRLTGGPSQGGCLSNFEQAGEGWSDWFGLVMNTTSSDNAEEGRGVGTYALEEPTNGPGIRDFRYSRDMGVNPHTYADINSVSVPHGVGSVWCVMIWDMYWNLIDEYGFDDDLYHGTGGNNIAMQLVLDGLKLQGCNPTFLNARDAIIAADEANNNGANVCLIWETFARRGLGANAQPGGIEDFSTPDLCNQTLKIRKTANVDEVDAGGIITYTLEIVNDEPNMLNNISVSDQLPAGTTYIDGSASCPNTSVSNGVLIIDVGSLALGGTITCTYQLQVDDAPFSYIELEDGMENGTDNWTTEAASGAVTWETSNASYEGNFAWFAENIETTSDQLLTLVDTFDLVTPSPSLAFWHRYNTEATWDGGVVEISNDYGNTWSDLGNDMIQNGYNSTLQVNADSPIGGRPAFNGNSNGYIQTIIDLSAYSGQEVQFRFRLGCDNAVSAEGWYVDNVQFFGELYSITNIACLSSSSTNEGACSETTTLVTGELSDAVPYLEGAFGLSLFPNPTSGNVFVQMKNDKNSPATIEIHSVDGRLLATESIKFSKGTHELNLSQLQEGIYLVQVKTEEGTVVRKLIVQ